MRWVAVFAFFTFACPANAAQISASVVGGALVVTLVGDIENGDQEVFLQKTGNAAHAIVILKSGGGAVLAGIGIGETIHRRGYSTVVLSDTMCASACGLIWIGGAKRMMQPRAMVGFHAAFMKEDGSVTSVGNALVGSYYGKLGLSNSAIVYLTEAAPKNIQWLTPEAANQLGIEVTSISASAPHVTSIVPSPVPPETGEMSGRLARAFGKRLGEVGVLGLNTSIEACYAQARSNHLIASATYCAALDILTFLYDQSENKRLNMRAEGGRNSVAEIRANTDAIAAYIGVTGKELRDRASSIALSAKAQIGSLNPVVAEAPPAYEPTPIQRQCSREADALNLHGNPRQVYRNACMSR